MPDLNDRADRERDLAAAILLVFQDYEDDWPDIDWLSFQSDLEAAIGPALTDTYSSSFSQLRDEMDLDLQVDPDQKAADWATKYSQELASLIVANSQAAALDADNDGSSQFDEARADKIAITETTRSITAGEFGVVGMAVGLGLMSGDEAVWQTAEDELVCEECEPLNEQPQDVWSLEYPAGPPAHPNCRCTLDYQVGTMESEQDKSTGLIEVPDIRQHDHYSCGAAAAMCVGRYFGVGPETLDEWKHVLGTDIEHSTNPHAIARYLGQLSLQVDVRQKMTVADLATATAQGKPVIVCVQDYGPYVPPEAHFDYGHYLTVIGVAFGYVFCQDSSEDNVIANSGSVQKPGRIMVGQSDFLRLWHDRDEDGNRYIRFGIIVGKPNTSRV